MSIQKIILIRHATTKSIEQKVHQNDDDQLSEAGFAEARDVARLLSSFNLDPKNTKVLSSEMTRSIQTAEIFVQENRNFSFGTTDLLNEIKRPSILQHRSYDDEFARSVKKLINDNLHNVYYKYSDEENFFDFKKRANSFFELHIDNKDTDKKFDTLILFTHVVFAKIISTRILFGEKFSFDEYMIFYKKFLGMGNGCISVFKKNQDNLWALANWNLSIVK